MVENEFCPTPFEPLLGDGGTPHHAINKPSRKTTSLMILFVLILIICIIGNTYKYLRKEKEPIDNSNNELVE